MLNSGLKFTDGIREMEIIEYMEQFKMYRYKNYTDNRENELMTEENIQNYIDKKNYYENKFNKGQQKMIEYERQEKQEKLKQQKKKREYEFCYGFVDDKIQLQQGKILKILNQKVLFNDDFITRKNLIHKLIKENKNIYTKKFLNTNRYSQKRINLEYKKLKDKKEYRLYFNSGERFINLTKTEYNYCNYLLNNHVEII